MGMLEIWWLVLLLICAYDLKYVCGNGYDLSFLDGPRPTRKVEYFHLLIVRPIIP